MLPKEAELEAYEALELINSKQEFLQYTNIKLFFL